MIKKKITKLIGLKKEEFDAFVKNGQIQAQSVKLIPTLKTGDEMALTSIFLSTIKLVKEYRDGIFKELKLSRSGKVFYFSEVCFPEIDKSRVDGLILIVIKGVITDGVFFEMKNKNNKIDKSQIESYLDVSKKLKVNKLVTVSNEFVADKNSSPVSVKKPKSIDLIHFSWTYLITKGQLLLFKNDLNIEDEDQVNIMKEVLHYFESPVSGIMGYTQMKPGWKQLAENVRAQKPLKMSDDYISDAILSWYEQEKDMTLMLSRKLGVFVKTNNRGNNTLKDDIKRVVKENYVLSNLSIKDSVSDIKVLAEFERRIVSMSVKIIPPLNKGGVARISSITKQLENCKKKDPEMFNKVSNDLWLEANVKFAKENIKVKISEIGSLIELTKGKEIQAFRITIVKSFGANFASQKKFIVLIEALLLEYYEGIVQHLSNWKRPAPRIEDKD